jgi:hypothetical protein
LFARRRRRSLFILVLILIHPKRQNMAHQNEDAPRGGDQRDDDDDHGEHPLLCAVRRDDVARVVKLLREKQRRRLPTTTLGGGGGNGDADDDDDASSVPPPPCEAAASSSSAPLPTAADGQTVLHLARSPQMVHALFDHGGAAVAAVADVGHGGLVWRTPLCAAAAKSAGVVRALLERGGASPDGAPRGPGGKLQHAGQTPLGEAAARLDADSVALLLAANANAALRNAFGNSAADRAFFSRHFAAARGQLGLAGGGVGPSGAGGAAAQQQHDEDEEEEEEGERLSPAEARDRFARTLVLLLRAAPNSLKPGYLIEALPLVAAGLQAEARAAADELERRRRDPRLAATGREDLVGLALDMGELKEAERELEAKHARLAELEGEAGDESEEGGESEDESGRE